MTAVSLEVIAGEIVKGDQTFMGSFADCCQVQDFNITDLVHVDIEPSTRVCDVALDEDGFPLQYVCMLLWGIPSRDVAFRYMLENQDRVGCLHYKYCAHVLGVGVGN